MLKNLANARAPRLQRRIQSYPQNHKFSQCRAASSTSPDSLVVRRDLLLISPFSLVDGRGLRQLAQKQMDLPSRLWHI